MWLYPKQPPSPLPQISYPPKSALPALVSVMGNVVVVWSYPRQRPLLSSRELKACLPS
jgi:hypothetical protein